MKNNMSIQEQTEIRSNVYKSQLQGLKNITEAINENASINQLFDIYRNALIRYYHPGVITLCVNTIRGMEVLSTNSEKKWEHYTSTYQKFNQKKSKYLRSCNGEVFIPVYHKNDL